MAKRQVEWPTGEDRAVAALSGALANAINNDRPEVTADEVRVLGEFLKLLMAMDTEQRLAK